MKKEKNDNLVTFVSNKIKEIGVIFSLVMEETNAGIMKGGQIIENKHGRYEVKIAVKRLIPTPHL